MISPYLAYVVFQVLENVMQMNLSWNLDFYPINAYKALKDMEIVRVLAAVICLYLLYLLFLALNPAGNEKSGKMQKITDKISIPAAVGNGQYGTARFLKLKEVGKLREITVFEYTGHNRPNVSGVVIGMEKRLWKERIFTLSDDEHVLILGVTRSGKGRMVLLESIWLQILSGENALIFDPKGEAYSFTSDFAASHGYQIMMIDLRDPDCGDHYNFLQLILDDMERKDISNAIADTWDLVALLVGERKGEAIWHNGECATIAATVLIIATMAPAEYQNLTNVYYFLAFMVEMDDIGEMYFSKLLNTLPDSHPAKGAFQMANVAHPKTRGSFFSSALGTLRHFTDPKISEMTSKTDISFENIACKKTIIYLIVPDEKTTLYSLGSLYVAQLYMSLTRMAIKRGNRVPIDWRIFADEFGQYPAIPSFDSFMSVGAGRGIRFVIVLQDYQQLQSKYKDSFETIKGNCQTTVYIKSPSPKTNKEVSEMLSTYTVQTQSSSTNMNTQKSGGNMGSSSNMASRALLTPGEVGKISRPYILVKIAGEDPAIMYAPDLSRYRANKQMGLGSKKQNEKVMMEKLNGRIRRKAPELKLWGIWNEYKAMAAEDDAPIETTQFF